MKKILFVVVAFIFLGYSRDIHAQFLKKLGDRIVDKTEKSIERRINNRADKGVEKSLDKVENGTEKAVNDAVTDSNKDTKKRKKEKDKRKVMQQAEWPVALSDGSTEKADPLPDDYQVAVTGSGPDVYLEYKMEMEGKQSGESGMDFDITMQMYVSPGKGGRSQINMEMPVIGTMRMAMLTNFNKPTQVILLNERKKAYSVIDLGALEEADESSEHFTVTKLGEEKLHGLHCVHAKATSEDGQSFEIWTTKEMPGYEKIMDLYSKSKQMGPDNLWTDLAEADCEGFMVKLLVETEGASSVMELMKMEKTTVPESLFQIPEGYKESNGRWTKRYMKMK